ncbi:hypothetical protein [Desulfobacula sp.]|uniref:hypothetical protein n=1 Tax=Desulfobacula sp. TaxID=2593537 RepID=UPI001EB28568|nr:hypothetical protein [Desulfobacula sp.]
MFDFDDFIRSLEEEIKTIASDTLGSHKDEAISDSKEFLDEIKTNLRQWTEELSNGVLSPADFKFLVGGKKDLATLHGLKQAGATLAKIDSFKDALIGKVITTAFNAIPSG